MFKLIQSAFTRSRAPSPAGIGDKPNQVNSLDSDAFLDNENRVTSDNAYYRIKSFWQVNVRLLYCRRLGARPRSPCGGHRQIAFPAKALERYRPWRF